MAIKLIASDLDGTFLAKDNSIPESNLKAIETIKQKQIPFAICTGKSYAVSKDICEKCEAHYGIFGNGTQIIDLKEQKEIFHHCLTLEEITTCYQIAHKYGLHIHAYGTNFILTEELKYLDLYNYVTFFHSVNSTFGKYDSEFNLTLTNQKGKDFFFYIVKNPLTYMQEKSLTIFNVILTSEGSLDLVKSDLEKNTNLSFQYFCKKGAYKDTVIHKEYEYLSIAPQSIGKGYALNILKDYLQVSSNDILSVGDNLNDIDLLKNSGIGVAIANAYEPVKAVATYTTQSSASERWVCRSYLSFYGVAFFPYFFITIYHIKYFLTINKKDRCLLLYFSLFQVNI